MALGQTAILLVAAGCLFAAAPVPAADPEATVVAELVVQARTPGPAWWRVSKGGSTVWVLGVPSGLPRGTRWESLPLARRLTGARRLITPPSFSVGLGDVFGALALRGKLKSKTPIEGSLPADLRARYLAAIVTLRQSPGHYDSWKPAVSGLIMLGDFRKRAGLDDSQPLAAARTIAGRKGVRIAAAASYKAMPFLRALAGEITEAVDRACLADALHEIEAGSGVVRAAAAGWARGDVRVALTAERGFEACLATLPDFNARVRQTMADEAAAIAHDLSTPGVSVAVIPLRALVAHDGVLERLKAEGYEIGTPASG